VISNRAMLKRLDNIGNARLKEITMPRAMPLVYELDADLEPVRSAYAFGPLSGRFL
jgi:2,3-bisphosphoglycerate-dependent phosphoglycerate mutase